MGQGDSAAGCGKGCSGGCASGGCNRLNTFDWISHLEIEDSRPFDLVEVSFKNGSRKNFYRRPAGLLVETGERVVVEASNGYDIGTVTLSGELVRLQMKKKRIREDQVIHSLIRRAHKRDLERLEEARDLEYDTMIRSRVIARQLNLEMKIGDVEYQGDRRKATFYYTAKGRVDFRELIRHYAREFRVKIEMRQIGARQESARIGGIGSCGRELCCSTWLTDFKSVTTSAARYQNLAINQAKLSGQCGRLKCCLNYELDTYMEALEHFPKRADRLQTEQGNVVLVKTDIFKQLMYYSYQDGQHRGKLYTLTVDQVQEIIELNREGKKPTQLNELVAYSDGEDDSLLDYEDVTGAIELPPEERKKRRKRRNKRKPRDGSKSASEKSADQSSKQGPRRKKSNRGRGRSNNTEANSGGETATNSDNKQPAANKNRGRGRNRNRRKKRGGGKPDKGAQD